MNNLFLSGNIRIGKSTLIRECLTPYRKVLGGFSSQRLLDSSGIVLGYRITEASDFDVERLYDQDLPGIFIIKKEGHRECLPSFFSDHADSMLTPPPGCRIMLLDEIGGIELLSDVFRSKLYELIMSDIPCIGVIKQNDASVLTDAGSPADKRQMDLAAENLALRSLISSEPNSSIIDLGRSSLLYGNGSGSVRGDTEKIIREFLTASLST